MKIVIDISDWLDENAQNEEDAMTLDDLITLAVKKGFGSAQLARMHIVQRELGLVVNSMLSGNKQLLQNGGTAAVNYTFARAKKEIELNGKQYNVREMVASVEDEGEDGGSATWYAVDSNDARESAEAYLDRRVPGHIMGRLLIIHESGGDVEGAVRELQEKVEGMLEDFREESAR